MGAVCAKYGSFNSQNLEEIDARKYGSKLEDIAPPPREKRRRISLKKVALKVNFKKAKKQSRKSSLAILQEEFDKVNRIYYDPGSNKAKNMTPLSLDANSHIEPCNGDVDDKEEQLDKCTKRNSCICFTTLDKDPIVPTPFCGSAPVKNGFEESDELL